MNHRFILVLLIGVLGGVACALGGKAQAAPLSAGAGAISAPKLLAKIDMDNTIDTTPVAVNGTLYVAARSKLFAIEAR